VGAYEERNATLVPGDLANLRWTSKTVCTWDAEPSAVEYHVYRGMLSSRSYSYFGSCRDDWDPVRTDLVLSDTEPPPAHDGFFYLVTAESAAGREATLGWGSSAERSNFSRCP